MDRVTYNALVEQTDGWRRLAALSLSEVAENPVPFALCSMYHRDAKRACAGCPVSSATGEPYCSATPQSRARLLVHGVGIASVFTLEERERHWPVWAGLHADFLAALVPAGGPDDVPAVICCKVINTSVGLRIGGADANASDQPC